MSSARLRRCYFIIIDRLASNSIFPSKFLLHCACKCICESEEGAGGEDREEEEEERLPPLPLPPLSARCNPNSNPIGPALSPRFGARSVRQSLRPSVRRGLPVAVCRPPCCRHSLDGPIRVRWPRCPRPRAADAVACGVPLLPSVPPPPPRLTRRLRRYRALRTKALQTSGSRSLVRPQCHLRARGRTRLPREQSPLSQSQSWVAGRRRRRRGLASHSLTIWFCGSTSRAASPCHAAVHCQCHMHRRSRTVARTDSSNGIGHPTVVACTALPSTSAVESQAGARHAPKT